jgi:hypothetical protein
MSREMTLIVLGILVIVTPYTGFPSPVRTAVLVICGVVIAGIGFLIRAHTLSKPGTHKTEHHPFQENLSN